MVRRNRDINLAVRINKEEQLRLKLRAEVEGKSISELVRELAK